MYLLCIKFVFKCFLVYNRASVAFKKPGAPKNRERKVLKSERKTKQTSSACMLKDLVISKPKRLPGPLLRQGKRSRELKNEIKLAWTVSQVYFTFFYVQVPAEIRLGNEVS